MKEQDAAHSFDETFYSQITEVRGWLLHNKIEVDEQSYVRLADALHAVSKFKPMESELTRLRSELQQTRQEKESMHVAHCRMLESRDKTISDLTRQLNDERAKSDYLNVLLNRKNRY